MKKVMLLPLLLLILTLGCKSTEESKTVVDDGTTELIINGDVSNETDRWSLYINAPAEGMMIAKDQQIIFFADKIGTKEWHIQGQYAGLKIYKGATYRLSVDMSSSIPRPGQLRLQLDASPYTGYLEEDIMLTEEMQTYEFEFVMEYDTDLFAKFCFNLGRTEGVPMEMHEIVVDNLSLRVVDETLPDLSATEERPVIAVNQIGYLPNSVKEVRLLEKADTFIVRSSLNNSEVYTGSFSKISNDPATGGDVYVGDFSDFSSLGKFYIEVPDMGNSWEFTIDKNVYMDITRGVVEMFYLQRCGFDLGERGGLWTHGECHTTEAKIFGTNIYKEVSGGWHDAGDYGRYVSPGAKAVADLILSAKVNMELINEIRYELEWMLKMQDEETGGVYHKVTTEGFIGTEMPDQNFEELILSPISPTATGTFAAVMAQAARKIADLDPTFAGQMKNASLKAWDWLMENPDVPGFKNPGNITTGEYGDEEDGDERFWAATELYLLTGDQTYHNYLKESYLTNRWYGASWMDMGSYGIEEYLTAPIDLIDEVFYSTLKEDYIIKADELLNLSQKDGFGLSMGIQYEWGSNQTVADKGIALFNTYRLTGDIKYREAAERHLHYLLGSNVLNISYVTAYGSYYPENPHHRPTNFVHQVMPGMLVGGPNADLQDPLAKSALEGKAPAYCYIDAEPSYSTNEITIYWNSPLYRLLTYITEL